MSKLLRLLPLLSSQILEEGVEVEAEKGEVEAIKMAADNFLRLIMINFKVEAEDGFNTLTNPR
jgi:hypothetical protein